MQKIGRLGVRKRRKSIPPAYHTPRNRPPGVRTPNSKGLTEALVAPARSRWLWLIGLPPLNETGPYAARRQKS